MRKMTKMAVTLAAMSAMTVAAASMVSADTNVFTATGKDAVAAGTGTGEWSGDDVNGWSFTTEAGTKLKNGWNQIDDVWYYFNKDGEMAQDELLYIEGETYYFNADGSMMANGWVGFDEDSDVLYDYDLDIRENYDDIVNPVLKNGQREDTYETVWLCFNDDGSAKDDEWYQADSGLWYHFDDIIMVAGDFDHAIGNAEYGFDENGAMLVGWAENYNDLMETAPNKDEKTWYYYNSDGKKFDATANGGYGWKKVGDDWYCFTSTKKDASVGTLIVNAYFTNDQVGTGNSDYYYVDKNGAMVTGVTTVDKDAAYVTYAYFKNSEGVTGYAGYTWADGKKIKNMSEGGKAVEVYFDKSSGKVKADTWNGSNFYAGMNAENVWEFDTDDTGSMAISNYASVNGNAAIKGALVKSSFIFKDDYYYVDKYGDKVVNSAIEVGHYENGRFEPGVEATKSDDGDYKAFVLAGSKGIIYDEDEVDKDRTVKIGSKKYIATDYVFNGMQVFYYENDN